MRNIQETLTQTKWRGLAIAAAVALATGCSSAAKVEPAATPPATPMAAKPAEAAPEITLQKVYFAYDKSNLTPDARNILKYDVDILLAHPGIKMEVDGNCDERGTDEYNMQLGWRRAYAVRDFVERMGVDKTRVFTNSYGRSRPAVIGNDEAAWSKNRRAELSVRSS